MQNKYLSYIALAVLIIIIAAISFFIGFESGKSFKAEKIKDNLTKMEEIIKKDQIQKDNDKNDSAFKIPFKSSGVDASQIEWLPKKIELPNLEFLNSKYSSFNYYQVARIKLGGALIVVAYSGGLEQYSLYFLEKNKEYFYLGNENDYLLDEIYKHFKNTSRKLFIEPDYKYILADIIPPDIIEINNFSFELISSLISKDFFNQDENGSFLREKIASTKFGDFYVQKTDIETSSNITDKVMTVTYFIILKDKTLAYYKIKKDFFADDDSLLAYLTTDKSFLGRRFNTGFISGGGCEGERGDQAVDLKNPKNRLVQIGFTNFSKTPLYTLKNQTDPLLKEAYENYKVGRENQKDLLSFASFAAKKPLLVWQGPLGDYLFFVDAEYDRLAEAECGSR